MSGMTSVTLSSDAQSYYAVIKAGATYFRVALDTASSDMWLISTNCTTSTCTKVPRYPLEYESGTYITVNDNTTAFSASYSDGTVAEGIVARESILFANISVDSQAFGLINSGNVSLTDDMSGIFGLGFPRLSSISDSVTNSTPFFVQLAQQGHLDYPLFGLSLTRNSSGTLTLGAIDASVVTNVSAIGWHPVVEFAPIGNDNNSSSYLQWATPFTSFAVNGTAFTPTPTYPTITSNTSLAMFDVGTSGIFGPYADVSRIFGEIGGARLVDADNGLYAIPCDTLVSMSFTFGDQTITLQPSDFLIGRASGNPNLCLSWPAANAPSSDGIDWQFGAPFLRTVYSVFSYGINYEEPPVIGFYNLRNETIIAESEQYISSYLSSMSATIDTALPNSLLPTPTYTTPPYTFNSSINAPTGGIVETELATSTYSAIFGAATNVSALPTLKPAATLQTLIVTGTGGVVTTITSTASAAAVTLGTPPGWIHWTDIFP
ncbi:aspartic peptidase domain-containing protein [Mucidula mucida]|nr:aspartic peptidase domain-containing protein [Mucidula mucida]